MIMVCIIKSYGTMSRYVCSIAFDGSHIMQSTMRKRIRRSSGERRRLMIAVAYLSSEGKLQSQIAEMLHLKQPEVSRLIHYAIEDKILRDTPTLRRDGVSDAELAEVRQL